MASTTPSNSHARADPAGIGARTQQCLRAARTHRARGAWEDVHRALDQAADVAAADAAASALVGDACARLEEYGRASAAYDRAIALAPERAGLWFNRAAVRRFLGQLREAEEDYDRCLALDPADTQACLNRAELRVQTAGHNHVPALEALLARGGAPWQREVPLRYALAKEYEDLGRHAQCWEQLCAGAALRRAHLAYDPRPDLATVDWLIDATLRVPAGAGDPSPAPIFILGMPRTGSTLVERMLGSHSQVHAAGELLHFGNAVVDAARQRLAPGAPADRHALIQASTRADFAALGRDYLARVRAGTPPGAARPHFTDKLPLNYLYCALIAAALPQARIVHVTRHPLATCYGVFKVLFDQGYPFSYDLGEIAEYFVGYHRLMTHWRSILGARLIEVSYESLVSDPPARCRALVDALGLRWEDACLDFHRNPAPTTTASASQVRRPIYASAVDQWRHYAAGLEPVRRRLSNAGIDCA